MFKVRFHLGAGIHYKHWQIRTVCKGKPDRIEYEREEAKIRKAERIEAKRMKTERRKAELMKAKRMKTERRKNEIQEAYSANTDVNTYTNTGVNTYTNTGANTYTNTVTNTYTNTGENTGANTSANTDTESIFSRWLIGPLKRTFGRGGNKSKKPIQKHNNKSKRRQLK
jgi:thymidylate synthase